MGREIVIHTTHSFKGKGKQDATIYFQNGIFLKCDYHINHLPYTLEDWELMGKISKFILSLKDLEKQQYNEAILAYEIDYEEK